MTKVATMAMIADERTMAGTTLHQVVDRGGNSEIDQRPRDQDHGKQAMKRQQARPSGVSEAVRWVVGASCAAVGF